MLTFTRMHIQKREEFIGGDLVSTSDAGEWCKEKMLFKIGINSLTPKLPSYRNQSIDLQSKSIDWFLYDGNFGV